MAINALGIDTPPDGFRITSAGCTFTPDGEASELFVVVQYTLEGADIPGAIRALNLGANTLLVTEDDLQVVGQDARGENILETQDEATARIFASLHGAVAASNATLLNALKSRVPKKRVKKAAQTWLCMEGD